MMKRQRITKTLLLFLIPLACITWEAEARPDRKAEQSLLSPMQNGRPNRARKKRMAGNRRREAVQPMHVDGAIGPAYNFASGPLIEAQKEVYKSPFKELETTGSFKNLLTLTGNIQFRYVPMAGQNRWLEMLSIGAGFGLVRKGFEHDYESFNKSFGYEDITIVSEKFRANYITLPITARYGGALYGFGGVQIEFLSGGFMERKIERTSFGEKAFLDSYFTYFSQDYGLTSKIMATPSVAYMFGLGYNIHPNVGVRWLGMTSSHFFKDGPALNNFQTSIQITGTFSWE